MKNIKQVCDELQLLCGPEWEIKPETSAAGTRCGWRASKKPFTVVRGFGETWEAAAEDLLEALTR